MADVQEIFRHYKGGEDSDDLFGAFKKLSRKQKVKEGIKQFEPKLHDVAQKRYRPDKTIMVPTGEKDERGEDQYTTDTAPVARVPIGLQKYIINQKASFARGSGVTLRPSYEDANVFEYVENNWYDNKTDFHLKDIAVKQMSETQCAVIFYGTRGAERFEDFRFKFKICSPSLGDTLTPYFDEDTGDLVAFARGYDIGDGKKKRSRMDVYVINSSRGGMVDILRYENGKLMSIDVELEDGEFSTADDIIQTDYTKLPVVYFEQEDPECSDTEELIREFEFGFSDFLTQMGYSADPILFGTGESIDMPPKGSPGKFITGSGQGADLKYVTPDNATEARELQFSMLQKFIFSLNRAVLLDLETMKELGDISGAALERYLIDAYMEATDKQMGSWGIGVQRMVNWMLHEWRNLVGGDKDLRINAVFSKFNVRDEFDRVELAMKASGGKPVVTHRTAITMAALEDDTQAAYDEIVGQAGEGDSDEV